MDSDGTGIGAVLREQRERRRLSIETIARATLIRAEYLQLIDSDELHKLPPGAYAKGFIRAYANYLGVDHRPLLQAYDERCGRPAPELSSVVRLPVRLPNATHPRTWRVAAGVGVGVLVLLGLVGVVRPGERAARPPVQSAADVAALASSTELTDTAPVVTNPADAAGEQPDSSALSALAAPEPNPVGATVRVEVVGSKVWVRAEPDSGTSFTGFLMQGEHKVFRGLQKVSLEVGDAQAVRLRVNGRDVGTPPGSVYRGTITPLTRGLPPGEPRPAKQSAP